MSRKYTCNAAKNAARPMEGDQRAQEVQDRIMHDVPDPRQEDQVKHQIDRDGGQVAEERRTDRRQRHQQPRECRIDQQLAGADDRGGAGGHRGRHQVEREQSEGEMSRTATARVGRG